MFKTHTVTGIEYKQNEKKCQQRRNCEWKRAIIASVILITLYKIKRYCNKKFFVRNRLALTTWNVFDMNKLTV